VAGVNWQAKLLSVRVLGKCGGYTSDIIDGMRWAAGLSVTGVPNNLYPPRCLT
jgi:serine protease